MRIAIPLDENRQDVCVVLARTPYFLFQDDGKESIVENPAAQAQGGAGIQAAQFLVDNDVNVLITVRCGQNAADVFAAAGIKIYKSVQKTRHTERNRTAEQIRKNKKTCPEETVYQIGTMDNHVPPEILMKVVAEFMDTLEKHGLCSLWIGAYLYCLCFL